MRMRKYLVLLLLLVMVVFGGLAAGQNPPPAAEIFWVDDDQTGQGNGSINNPFATIQEGIDEAGHGDVVRVRDGTYYENIDFKGKAITVRSDDRIYGDTIIDGGQNDSCVVFKNGEGNDSVLKGFTLQNGSGHPCSPDTPQVNDRAGGGVYAWASSPIVSYCEFRDNHLHADYYGSPSIRHVRAAAMYCGTILEPQSGGSSTEEYVYPIIRYCSIHDNYVTETSYYMDNANGGGIAIDNPSWPSLGDGEAHIEYNTFYDNATTQGWIDLNTFSRIIDPTGTVYIEWNEFYNTEPDDTINNLLYLGHVDSVYFRNNLFHDTRDFGGGAEIAFKSMNFLSVDGNTFYNAHKGGTVMTFNSILYTHYVRNIMWDSWAGQNQIMTISQMYMGVCDYNIFEGGADAISTWFGGSYTYGTHNVETDPNLDSTYHIPNIYSSAWETGGDNSVGFPPDKDIDGERRLYGEQYDIGCDEWRE